MEHDKDDRRTRRTRQLLRDALLSLLKEKRYVDISVQDIIERADVAPELQRERVDAPQFLGAAFGLRYLRRAMTPLE